MVWVSDEEVESVLMMEEADEEVAGEAGMSALSSFVVVIDSTDSVVLV